MSDLPSTSTNISQEAKEDDTEDSTVLSKIEHINSQVAQFRDLLINIGQPRDCPELRVNIRKLRRSCIESCKIAARILLPQVQRTTDIGIPTDSPNLVLLFYVIQLFLRELCKSKNLIRIVPMDMKDYYENQPGPSNIGNVISQILLSKQITVDFNEEELCCIRKESKEIRDLIKELQEFMPYSSADSERYTALQNNSGQRTRNNGAPLNNTNESRAVQQQSQICNALKFLCCAARTDYM